MEDKRLRKCIISDGSVTFLLQLQLKETNSFPFFHPWASFDSPLYAQVHSQPLPKSSTAQHILPPSTRMAIHYHHTERTTKHELRIKIIKKMARNQIKTLPTRPNLAIWTLLEDAI